MKFVCLSDIHLIEKNPGCRKDNLVEEQFKKLSFIFDYAKKNNCRILQAGDFFDKPRSYFLLVRLFEMNMPQIISVPGQHDMYNRNLMYNNFDILSKTGYINYCGGGNDIEFENIVIKGCPYGAELPKPSQNTKNILVIHAPIRDEELYPGHIYTDAHKFLVENKFDLIVCGDMHKKFYSDYGGRYIVNSGCMNRTKRDLYDHSPGFWVFDFDKTQLEWIEIPHESSEKAIDMFTEIEDRTDIDFSISAKNISCSGIDVVKNLIDLIKKMKIKKRVLKVIDNTIKKSESGKIDGWNDFINEWKKMNENSED